MGIISRSRKKHPFSIMRLRYGKNLANRRVRRLRLEISNGREYTRLYPSWDVIDWIFYGPRGRVSKDSEEYQRWYVRK